MKKVCAVIRAAQPKGENVAVRKWSVACMALVLMLLASACTSPFAQPEQTEPASAERTYVITEQTHEGLDKMADGVDWQDNALCAMQYIGSRSGYAKNLRSTYRTFFSDVDQASFDTLQQIDVGGDEVYLVVPRFDLETFSVFSIAIDSNEKVHILKQAAETPMAFLLFCNTTTDPNAAVSITLKGGDREQKMRIVMKRDPQTGALNLPAGVQSLEP